MKRRAGSRRRGARAKAPRDPPADVVHPMQRLDAARDRLRRTDPGEAMRLWEGLVDGRWSLVDTFESDGKRYIVARRNGPHADPKALTARERQVLALVASGHSNKYVGYVLGLAPTTVATHLESARRKLGARSRRELIGIFGCVPRGGDGTA